MLETVANEIDTLIYFDSESKQENVEVLHKISKCLYHIHGYISQCNYMYCVSRLYYNYNLHKKQYTRWNTSSYLNSSPVHIQTFRHHYNLNDQNILTIVNPYPTGTDYPPPMQSEHVLYCWLTNILEFLKVDYSIYLKENQQDKG